MRQQTNNQHAHLKKQERERKINRLTNPYDPTEDVKLGPKVLDAVIARAEGVPVTSVTGQRFKDAQGKKKLDTPFSCMDISLGKEAVSAMTIKCGVKR